MKIIINFLIVQLLSSSLSNLLAIQPREFTISNPSKESVNQTQQSRDRQQSDSGPVGLTHRGPAKAEQDLKGIPFATRNLLTADFDGSPDRGRYHGRFEYANKQDRTNYQKADFMEFEIPFPKARLKNVRYFHVKLFSRGKDDRSVIVQMEPNAKTPGKWSDPLNKDVQGFYDNRSNRFIVKIPKTQLSKVKNLGQMYVAAQIKLGITPTQTSVRFYSAKAKFMKNSR